MSFFEFSISGFFTIFEIVFLLFIGSSDGGGGGDGDL